MNDDGKGARCSSKREINRLFAGLTLPIFDLSLFLTENGPLFSFIFYLKKKKRKRKLIKNLGEMYDDLWGQKILNAKIILFYVVAATDKMTRIEGPAGEQSLPIQLEMMDQQATPRDSETSFPNSLFISSVFILFFLFFI